MTSDRRIHAGLLSRRVVEHFPDMTVALSKGRRLLYSELDEASNRLANTLLGLGLAQGVRAASQLSNSLGSMIVPRAVEKLQEHTS
jgi:non-ribosomal peptide synthetase component E (peptide arylation enzyme)